MSEMKLHKLLYFAQKRHYKNFGCWLFDDDFEGWVHGPVNKRVRASFDMLPDVKRDELTLEEEYTIREILHEYGHYTASQLRNLSHQEYAYKQSRIGLGPEEPGDRIIKKEEIIFDIVSEQNQELYV